MQLVRVSLYFDRFLGRIRACFFYWLLSLPWFQPIVWTKVFQIMLSLSFIWSSFPIYALQFDNIIMGIFFLFLLISLFDCLHTSYSLVWEYVDSYHAMLSFSSITYVTLKSTRIMSLWPTWNLKVILYGW